MWGKRGEGLGKKRGKREGASQAFRRPFERASMGEGMTGGVTRIEIKACTKCKENDTQSASWICTLRSKGLRKIIEDRLHNRCHVRVGVEMGAQGRKGEDRNRP